MRAPADRCPAVFYLLKISSHSQTGVGPVGAAAPSGRFSLWLDLGLKFWWGADTIKKCPAIRKGGNHV